MAHLAMLMYDATAQSWSGDGTCCASDTISAAFDSLHHRMGDLCGLCTSKNYAAPRDAAITCRFVTPCWGLMQHA